MASSSIFSKVEEEKMTEIIDSAILENTKRQTTWSVSISNGELCKSLFFFSSLFSHSNRSGGKPLQVYY